MVSRGVFNARGWWWSPIHMLLLMETYIQILIMAHVWGCMCMFESTPVSDSQGLFVLFIFSERFMINCSCRGRLEHTNKSGANEDTCPTLVISKGDVLSTYLQLSNALWTHVILYHVMAYYVTLYHIETYNFIMVYISYGICIYIYNILCILKNIYIHIYIV